MESLTRKEDVDKLILNTIDKVLVLPTGRASDVVCMQLDEMLAKSVRDVSKFVSIGLIDADAPEIQSRIKYFDISLIPATIFFFKPGGLNGITLVLCDVHSKFSCLKLFSR